MRLIGMLLLLLGLAAAPVMADPATATSRRIIAIGDLHGDHAAWQAIARQAGVMDAGGQWQGGATILVQIGDVPDRGPDSRSIIADLMRLQREAPKQGGKVIVLVGNHEAMIMTGDLRYVSAGEYARFADSRSDERRLRAYRANRLAIEQSYRDKTPGMADDAIRRAWLEAVPPGRIELQSAWQPRGPIGRWVVTNPAVALIDGTLFVHAGIGPRYADWSIARINDAVATALKEQQQEPTAIIHDPEGPLWYRGLAREREGTADLLSAILARHGATRMVIGHTPSIKGIAFQFYDRLVRIDTGISAAYGGEPSYLEIIGDAVTAHRVARPAPMEAAGR